MKKSPQIPQKQCPLTLEMKHGHLFDDPNMDLKKIRRTISNRLSAQRYRIKKEIHTHDLEKIVKDLEALVSILTPQLEIYKENKTLLQLENDSLRSELEKRSNESKRLEMTIEEKRAKIKRLKELEETALKNKQLASDSKAQEIPYFGLEPLKVAPYPNIHLYQICLQNLLKNPRPSRVLEMAPDSAIEQSGTEIKPAKVEVEKTIQEYEDVDQYINFDALSAVDAADVRIEPNFGQ